MNDLKKERLTKIPNGLNIQLVGVTVPIPLICLFKVGLPRYFIDPPPLTMALSVVATFTMAEPPPLIVTVAVCVFRSWNGFSKW